MMQKKLTVAVFGATGLIGSHLIELLSKNENVNSIKVLSRKPLVLNHPKITNTVTESFTLEVIRQIVEQCDVAFCAIGTTQNKVKGNKQLYQSIDYQIPVNIAKACEEHKVTQLHIVSAVGANAESNNFYLSLKGRMERDVSHYNIPTVYFYRPSLLLGQRNEKRFGEKLAQRIMPIFNWATPSKYQAIEGYQVADAMLHFSINPKVGNHILHYKEMIS